MSNVIRDVEKLNQRQIETAKRRGEREVKNIESAHQNYKAELKKAHDSEIVDIQHANHQNLNVEAEKKEKILAEMRTHLQQSKDMTEKQLKDLKNNSERQNIEIQQKMSEDRGRINSENELYLEDLNDRYNQSSQKIVYEGKKRVEDTKSQMLDQKLEAEKFHQDRIDKQTESFTTRFKNDTKNYQNLKDNQDNQFKKDRLSSNLRQQVEMKKMTENHTGHMETRDKEYRKGLKNQDQFFEKKYETQLTGHNEQFKALEEKNKKVVEDLKASLTKEITQSANRNDDPFYKFETLKPKFNVFEDRVEVEVAIPEHSKQDVQLSINGKEAIVSFNRRYSDANKTAEGNINKVNKVESFTTRLQTGHFLNARSVKSNYDNGVMTYVIKKA